MFAFVLDGKPWAQGSIAGAPLTTQGPTQPMRF
jgi:hypothetical protein